jgi:hypothetical protein
VSPRRTRRGHTNSGAPLWVGTWARFPRRVFRAHCRACCHEARPCTVALSPEHGAALALGLDHLAEHHPTTERTNP